MSSSPLARRSDDNACPAKARLEALRGKSLRLFEPAVGLNPDRNDPSYDLAPDSTFDSRERSGELWA